MSTRDLLIFMAILTSVVIGITLAGWIFFHRWYVEEKTNGRRQIDVQKAELIRQKKRRLP